MKRFISFGAGVNSMALLVKFVKDKVDFDGCVFADVGSEMPETYAYIDAVIKPFCAENNIPFFALKSKYRVDGISIYEHYFSRKCIPTFMRRDCTDKFKKNALFAFAKSQGATRKEPVTYLIGIALDERQRVGKSQVQYINLEYPLVDGQVDRSECIKLILKAGLPIPVKSGCFFCPFQRKEAWISLRVNHPDLFSKAKELEENAKLPLNATWWLREIDELPKFDLKQTKLCLGEKWNSCVCFKSD